MRTPVFGIGLLLALAAPGRGADDPAALVRRAIDAAGGAEKLKQCRASYVRADGTLFQGAAGVAFRVEHWRDGAARSRTEMTVAAPTGEVRDVKIIAGGEGWWARGNGAAMRLEGPALESGRVGLYVSGVADLVPVATDPAFTLAPLGGGEVGGRPADAVRVSRRGQPDVALWFDRESGLLAKYSARFPGGVQDQVLSEYKDFGGVKRPTRRVGYRDGVKAAEDRVTEYKVLAPVDEQLFRLPGAGPADGPREVIARYAAAAGGADRLKKLKCEYARRTTRVFSATAVGGAGPVVDVETEFWADYPTAVRQVVTQEAGGRKVTRTQVYADGAGWVRDEGRPARVLTADEVRYWRETVATGWADEVHTLLDDPAAVLTPLGRADVGGRPAVGVRVARPGWPEVSLWFDAGSHLLVKREDRAPDGRAREKFLSDYTERDGIRRPTRTVILLGGQKAAEITTTDHRHYERLDPALLGQPKD